MQGVSTKDEIFLTEEDISKNKFNGVNRTLVEEEVVSNNSSDSDIHLPPMTKLTKILEQNVYQETSLY